MNRTIDLNADMGEYANAGQQGTEAALMPLISSCSIACGGHAGDHNTMRATARLAKAHGVSVGAHPSYPDRENFGRRSLKIAIDELYETLVRQIADLQFVMEAEGLPLKHIKPHGALYTDAAGNEALAQAIIASAQKTAPGAAIIGPPGSHLEQRAKNAGQAFIAEGFIDRLYQLDGALTPRNAPGAVIDDVEARAQQALTIAKGEALKVAGGYLSLCVETLCIHSDSASAVETARLVRRQLEDNGFTIKSVP